MTPLNIASIRATVAALAGQFNPSGPSLAVQFVYPAPGGQNRVGTRSALKREIVNSDAGLNTSYVYSLICPLAQFGTVIPESKQRVSVAGVTYKVLSVELDSIGATIRIHLGSEYDR